MKKSDAVYIWGIVIIVVSMIGSYKGYAMLSIIAFAIGFAMILSGYIK